MHLNEGPNVALNKLFSESSVITPHGTAVIKNGTARIFPEAQAVIVRGGQQQLPNNGAPMTLPGRRGGAGDERDLAGQDIDWVQQVFVGRPRAGSIHCGEFP